MSEKVEVAKFDGKGDFGIWKLKMKGLLSLKHVLIALEEDMTKWSEDQQKWKVQIREDVYYLVILSLSDSVIRKVSKAKTPTELWSLLDKLYGNVLAPNLAYFKASVYSFRFDSARTVDENLDEFLKLILLLEGTEYAVDEVSQVMILLNVMPDDFQFVKDAFQYTGSVPSYDSLCVALRTMEAEIRKSKSKCSTGQVDSNKRNKKRKNKTKDEDSKYNKGSNSTSAEGSKSQGNKGDQLGAKGSQSGKKCFYCDKVGHFKKDCYKWLRKMKENKSENNLAVKVPKDTCEAEVLNVTTRKCSDE